MIAPALQTVLDLTESVVSTTVNLNVQTVDRLSLQTIAVDATPAAGNFVAADVNTTDNTITIADHGFVTGLKVALSGTNLPGGLSATNYWVIVVDSSTIKLSDSLAHALAGTNVVDITTQGTTNDAALTPPALGTATVGLKASLDGVNFFAFSTPKTISITTTANAFLDCGQVSYPWCQVYFTAPVTGALTLRVLLYAMDSQAHNNA